MGNRNNRLTVFLALLLLMLLVVGVPAEERLSEQLDSTIEGARETAVEEWVLFPGWTVDLSAGYSLSRGNTDSEDFMTRGSASKKFADIWELIIKGEYARGEIKDKDTGEYEKNADRGLVSGQANYFVIENGFLYSLTEVSYDKMRNLDRRVESGAGIGYDFYRRERSSATVEAGVAYIESKYYPDDPIDPDEDYRVSEYYLRLAQKGNFRINERVALIESVEYKPQIDDFDNYILTGEISLKVNLRSNLYFMFSILNRYESKPASGLERNDVRIISSLGITL